MTAKGVDFEAINYTKEPLSAEALMQLLRNAVLKPQNAIRTNEAAYQEYVAGQNLSDERLVHLMVEHPELVQKPIVVRGNKVVLARPVERLADLDIK